MERCGFKDKDGNPITFMPDGQHPLDACEYEEIQRLRNVTVSVLRCRRCGHIEIAWERQEDTEDAKTD